jgi:hypothetical protein
MDASFYFFTTLSFSLITEVFVVVIVVDNNN